MKFISKCHRTFLHKSLLTTLLALVSTGVSAESIDDLINRPLQDSAAANVESVAAFRGQFRSVNYAVLSAGIAAKVKSFNVKTGSRIEAGEVIAEFNCAIPRVEKKITQARQQAAAESLKVNQRLNDLKNISELELNISAAELAIAEAELERTDRVLEQCIVKAPFSGTITEKMAQAFEYVNVGDPLVELIDTEHMEIEMILPSLFLSRYQVGASFSMQIDETDQVVEAVVERVVNVIDPVSQTVRIIGSLKDPAPEVMPGMSGQIVFDR